VFANKPQKSCIVTGHGSPTSPHRRGVGHYSAVHGELAASARTINKRILIRKPCKESRHIQYEFLIEDQKMTDNVPNLNVNKLLAYASAKHLAGVSDEEIREDIVRMLRSDS